MEKKERIWNPLFTTLFIANACMNLSQQMMNSLVSKYAASLGAAATVIGVVSSIYALTALIFKILSGPIIDTYNKRHVGAITMGIMAVSFLGYALSTSVPMLIGSRLIQGIGQAFTSTCCLAMAADTLPKSKFGSGIGIYSMAQAASQAIGPALSLALVNAIGYRATFFTGCGIMFFAAFLVMQVKVPFQRTKKFQLKIGSIIAKPAIMPAAIIFLLSITFFVVNSFLIVYAEEIGVDNIGYYFTVFAGCMLVTRPMVGKLTDRFGIVKMIIPSLCCFAASFFIISYARSLPAFLLAAFVASFGYGTSVPALQTLSMKCVPPEQRGAGSSTNYIGTDLGSLVGPIIAGKIVEMTGYSSMWRIMTVPIFIALVAVILFSKRIANIEANFENMKEVRR